MPGRIAIRQAAHQYQVQPASRPLLRERQAADRDSSQPNIPNILLNQIYQIYTVQPALSVLSSVSFAGTGGVPHGSNPGPTPGPDLRSNRPRRTPEPVVPDL